MTALRSCGSRVAARRRIGVLWLLVQTFAGPVAAGTGDRLSRLAGTWVATFEATAEGPRAVVRVRNGAPPTRAIRAVQLGGPLDAEGRASRLNCAMLLEADGSIRALQELSASHAISWGADGAARMLDLSRFLDGGDPFTRSEAGPEGAIAVLFARTRTRIVCTPLEASPVVLDFPFPAAGPKSFALDGSALAIVLSRDMPASYAESRILVIGADGRTLHESGWQWWCPLELHLAPPQLYFVRGDERSVLRALSFGASDEVRVSAPPFTWFAVSGDGTSLVSVDPRTDSVSYSRLDTPHSATLVWTHRLAPSLFARPAISPHGRFVAVSHRPEVDVSRATRAEHLRWFTVLDRGGAVVYEDRSTRESACDFLTDHCASHGTVFYRNTDQGSIGAVTLVVLDGEGPG